MDGSRVVTALPNMALAALSNTSYVRSRYLSKSGDVCSPADDRHFGPAVGAQCRNGFDFTLLFEQTILSILPSVILLVLTVPRFSALLRASVKTWPDSMGSAKMVTAMAYAGIQLALIVLWSKATLIQTRASVPSAAVSFIVSLAIIALSHVEHNRSIRPSTLLNVYLLFSLLFDVIQARTLYLMKESSSISGIFTASIGLKLALLILETQEKRPILRDPYRRLSPEATSGIFSRSFFWWLNGLFIEGFRSILTFESLFDIDAELDSRPLRDRMQEAWDQRSTPARRLEFLWAAVRFLRWPILWVVPARLSVIGFSFAQPFLISRAISYVQEPNDSQTADIGYGLIAAAALVYLGIAISNAHYNHRLYRLITMFRGASVGLIYNRTLILQDGVYDESAAVTLMSTDIDRIATSIRSADDVWAGIIQVSLGMYLLARQLGWVCVMPVLVILASSFGSSAVAKRIGGRQGIWAAAVQQRVAITSSMLGSMRSVKMMGLADMMTTTVQGQRVREVMLAASYRWMIVWLNVVANIPATFAPIVTFVVFAIQAAVRGSGSLNTNQAFTSLAIISLTSQPAAYLLAAIPVAASALGCLDRIQKFLLATSWEDQRRNAGTKPETSVGPRKGEEGIELQVMPAPVQDINLRAIEVKDATIRPSLTAQPVLRNLNVDIEKGSLTMVLGPVGCGKSTLMRAILGELPCDSGNVSVASKRIAYCSQMPWLLNTSIRHSIYGSRQQEAVDENWYQTVLHACALDEDMLQLPHGDLSVIGSKGLTLSGGQKQRLALARAVYARQEIVLLDDILSALDGKTERAIVDRLLSPQGLFYRLSSTVVLITHSTRHLALATKIIVLGVGGEIVQQGTYNELRKTPGFIQSLQENQQDTTEPKETPISNVRERKELKGPSREQAIDLTRKTGDVAVYSYYMNSIGWPLTIMFVGSCCMFAFAFNFPQIWLKWWTEAGRSQIRKYISVYIILGCVAAFFNAWIMITIFIYVTPKSAARLHYILLCTVMRAPASFFAATDTGETLNRFSQDMTLIDGTLPTSLMVVTITLTEAIVQLALIATGSTYMAISIPFFAFGLYILQKVYLRTSRQLRFMDLEARSPVYSHFLETLEGLSVIRAFGWQGEVGDVNIKRLDASQRPYYLLYCIQRWLNLVLDLMVAAMGVIVIALAVQLRASTNAGLLGIALNNILSFNGTLSQLVNYWTELETSLGAIARLKNFESQIKPEEQPGENVIPPHSWPESGAIEFRNVTAAYNPTALALRNISIDIRPGQKVGICGRTGSGKSSLLSALLRLLDMQSGAIFVDGIDLSTVPREQIRSRMIAIPQDPFIISDTVRLNADPSSIVPDPLIITALTNIGLWQIIESRGGLDANMKEQPLSQGQQQLFCLARAMLRRSKILILDEATSNVDGETDQLMQKIIREEFREHTILTVAHRLETIMDADNVAVLEAGELLEYGPPKELMAKESRFRELHG